MKKCAYSLILFFTFTMIGCFDSGTKNSSTGEGSAATDESIVFSVCDTTIKFIMDTFDSNSPCLDIEISLPFTQGESSLSGNINSGIIYAAFGLDSMSPQAAISTLINNAGREYLANRPDYINEKSADNSPAWFNHRLMIKGSNKIGYKECINYTIDNYYYEGGAHGMENLILLNFDPKSGKEIKLQDFFVENFEEPLTSLLLESLSRQIGATSIAEINDKGYFNIEELYPTENFRLAPDSIIFVYNSYEIAPYSMGRTRIALGYNQIENLIKK